MTFSALVQDLRNRESECLAALAASPAGTNDLARGKALGFGIAADLCSELAFDDEDLASQLFPGREHKKLLRAVQLLNTLDMLDSCARLREAADLVAQVLAWADGESEA